LSSSTQHTADHHATNIWPDVSLIGVALIWGVNIPLMKIGLEQVDIYVYNAVRLAISAMALASFAWRERRTSLAKPTLEAKHILLYAAMIGASYQLLFLEGISRTTSGNTALIISTVPMWTALLAWLFLGEELRKLAWLGLSLSLAGTVIVALQKGDVVTGSKHLVGNLIVLAAAVMWASGTVYSRKLLKKISSIQLAAASTMLALPVHLCWAAGEYKHSLPAFSSPSLWLIIIYSGVLSSGLSQPMWHYGVRHAGAAHAAIVQNLVPLFAIIAAWFARGESITTAQLLGGALILSGLITMRLTR